MKPETIRRITSNPTSRIKSDVRRMRRLYRAAMAMVLQYPGYSSEELEIARSYANKCIGKYIRYDKPLFRCAREFRAKLAAANY